MYEYFRCPLQDRKLCTDSVFREEQSRDVGTWGRVAEYSHMWRSDYEDSLGHPSQVRYFHVGSSFETSRSN